MSSQAKKKKKNEHMNKIIQYMDASSKVGNQLMWGVSGGERKTSISMDVISDPTVPCLDDFTTGLDADTSPA